MPEGHDAGAWRLHGSWSRTSDRLRYPAGDPCALAVLDVPTPQSYLLKVNVAAASEVTPRGSRWGLVTSYRDEGNHTTVSIDPDRGALTWETVRDGERTEGGRFGPLRRDFAPGASHQLLLRPGPDATRVTLDGVSMGTLPPALQPQGPLGVWTSHTGVTVTGVTLTDLA